MTLHSSSIGIQGSMREVRYTLNLLNVIIITKCNMIMYPQWRTLDTHCTHICCIRLCEPKFSCDSYPIEVNQSERDLSLAYACLHLPIYVGCVNVLREYAIVLMTTNSNLLFRSTKFLGHILPLRWINWVLKTPNVYRLHRIFSWKPMTKHYTHARNLTLFFAAIHRCNVDHRRRKV